MHVELVAARWTATQRVSVTTGQIVAGNVTLGRYGLLGRLGNAWDDADVQTFASSSRAPTMATSSPTSRCL